MPALSLILNQPNRSDLLGRLMSQEPLLYWPAPKSRSQGSKPACTAGGLPDRLCRLAAASYNTDSTPTWCNRDRETEQIAGDGDNDVDDGFRTAWSFPKDV